MVIFIASAYDPIAVFLEPVLPVLVPMLIAIGYARIKPKLDKRRENKRSREKQQKEQDLNELLASGAISESDYRLRMFCEVILPKVALIDCWIATELPKYVHGCYLLRDQLDKAIELYSSGIAAFDQQKSARYASYLACAKAYKLCLELDVAPPNLNMLRAIISASQAEADSLRQIKSIEGGEQEKGAFLRMLAKRDDLNYIDPVYCEWIVKKYCWAIGEKSANIFKAYNLAWHEQWAKSYPLDSARGWEVKVFPHVGPDADGWTKAAWITVSDLAYVVQCNDTGRVVLPARFFDLVINRRMTLDQFETTVLPELVRRYWLIVARSEQFEKKIKNKHTENMADDEIRQHDTAMKEIAAFNKRLADRFGLNGLGEGGRYWNYWVTCEALDDEKGVIAQTFFLLEEYCLVRNKAPENLLLPKPDVSDGDDALMFEELDDALSCVKITNDRKPWTPPPPPPPPDTLSL